MKPIPAMATAWPDEAGALSFGRQIVATPRNPSLCLCGSNSIDLRAWSRPMSTDSSDLFGALFEAPPANRTVPVLVPMPAPKPYSYSVPDGMAVEPGSVVQVPLGPRQVIGVVWDGGESV